MNSSIFDDIKSFFSGPSEEKCTKEEKKENDKHAAKVNEENDRHSEALKKIKENTSCKIKYTDSTPIASVINSMPPAPPAPPATKVISADNNLDFDKDNKNAQPELYGGRKRRTRRPRKSKGKNTRRSR